MAAVIGSLRADLSASIAQFQSDMGAAADAVKKFAKEAKAVAKELQETGEAMSVALTLPIVAFGVEAVKASQEAAQAFNLLQAAMISTGNASGKTADQLDKSADALRAISTFDKDQILKGVTANLLTFGNVQGAVFDRAQLAIVNLASKMGEDLQSATVKVGRALQDPIKGMTALTRLGVSFTDQQKQQIRALVQSGDGMKAQGIILGALEQKFDGAALAMRNASPTAELKNEWKELAETIGGDLTPRLKDVADSFAEVLKSFKDLDPQTRQLIETIAGVVAVIGPLLVGTAFIIKSLAALGPTFVMMGTWIGEAVGWLADLALAFVGLDPIVLGVIAVFATLGAAVAPYVDEITSALSEVWTYLINTLGPAFGQLITTFEQAWADLAAFFTAIGNGPIGAFFTQFGKYLADLVAAFTKWFGKGLVDILVFFVDALDTTIDLVVGAIETVIDLLQGDWQKAWKDASTAGIAAMKALANQAPNKNGNPLSPPPELRGVSDLPPATAPTPPKPVFNQDNAGALKKQADALQQFETALTAMQQKIANALTGATMPKAIEEANALNAQIDAFVKKAQQAGVNTGAFASQIAALRANIETLKVAELAKEAEKFSEAVNADSLAVDKFGKGGLPPLQAKLQEVDDQYKQLHDKITDEITANAILAQSNDVAAAAMDRLKAKLAALEKAHATATAAAIAQNKAELELDRLNTAKENLTTANAIQDLQQSTGKGSPISSAQEDLQATTRALQQQQLDAETKLTQEIKDRDAAQMVATDADGQAKVDNLNSEIALQQQLLDLVKNTSATQIEAAKKVDEAFKSFTDDLSQQLADLAIGTTNGWKDVMNTFRTLAEKLFVKPLTDDLADQVGAVIKRLIAEIESGMGGGSGGGGIGGLIASLFGGGGYSSGIGDSSPIAGGVDLSQIGWSIPEIPGFAEGGFLPPGQWGIAGENGPEPIFGGPHGMGVIPTDQANLGGGRRTVNQIWNITTPDANSFRATQRQTARQAKQGLAKA